MAVHTKWYTASKYALALRGEYGTDARRRRGIFLRQDIFLLGIEGLLRTRVAWRGLIGFAFASLRTRSSENGGTARRNGKAG